MKELNPTKNQTCPYCGANLPAEAAFCPHCARSINPRKKAAPPARLPRKALRLVFLVLLAALLVCFLYQYTRPQRFDGLGEVNYTDADGSYQLLVNISDNRYEPLPETHLTAGDEERYRFPLRLYINHKDSGADASGIFLQKVQASQITVEQPDGSPSPVLASEPKADSTFPNVAQVSYVDFTKESPQASELVWRLSMNNGDILRIRFKLFITPVQTWNYDADNANLADADALQALIDQLAEDSKISDKDTVNIYLPPVTYTKSIVLHSRSFNLYGTEENGQRSTFSAGIQQRGTETTQAISYFTDLDFTGDGSGVGLSTAGRSWVQNCRFTNLKTAVLSFGRSWVNSQNCQFDGNDIGLHYNAVGGTPADTRFTGNTFNDNRTAVLLEEVPSDVTMDFADCLFRGNDTDIDNRCEQPLDLTKASFY